MRCDKMQFDFQYERLEMANTPEKKQRMAFTLVELLVVISIMALLLSILLPSLNQAREQAKRVVCKSNLRNLGLAATMYAEDNSNLLPETRWDAPPWNGDPMFKYTWFIKNKGTYMIWGKLYELGYMENIACFYCPSQRHPLFSYPPVRDSSPEDLDVMRSSYLYRSCSWDNAGKLKEMFKLTQNGRPAIAADLFHDQLGLYPHLLAHKKGYNVLYLDGHVNFVSDNLLYPGLRYGAVSMDLCWEVFTEND